MLKFNGIGSLVVTFEDDGISGNVPCTIDDNEMVADTATGEVFCGVCVWQRGGYVGVQIKGFVTLPYTGTAPAVGYGQLVGNGTGGVAVGTTGPERLIVEVNTTDKTVTFCL